tara:strand:- start:16824 stop:18347 length:1524 start_codon:yes stop_codon:yes gene_type:complete
MNNLYYDFEKIVNKYSKRHCLIFQDKKITYKELYNLSIKFYNRLSQFEIREGDSICIESEKNPEVYAIMLASLKLGVPYFFLDKNSPLDKKLDIIAQAKPIIYFYEEIKTRAKIKHSFNIKNFLKLKNNKVKLNNKNSKLSSIAYYMFTSGSTGKAKGVIINQYNLKHFINWAIKEFKFDNKTIHAGLNLIFFDNSVFDFYISIFSGATLLPIKKIDLIDPTKVIKNLKKNKCNSWFSVPTLIIYFMTLRLLKKENLPNLKRIIFGGEGFMMQKLRELYKEFGDSIVYSNVYGPTEATCMCSNYNIKKIDFKLDEKFPPIGELHRYFDGYLWNKNRENKNVGELVLGGPCIGQGYLNEQKIKNSGFKKDPLIKNYNRRVYFTGDIFKYDGRKRLNFVGRIDNQIKHNGIRIELEEIESRIRRYKNIKDVLVFQVYKNFTSYLIASIIVEKNFDFKNFLQFNKLNMLKHTKINFFNKVKKFPKQPNGKIDRIESKKICIKNFLNDKKN